MSTIERDLKTIWHPCSQMKDYEHFPPIEICSAEGAYLYLNNGRTLIDASSSWWCKSLGHGHPKLREAMIEQVKKFEHVMLANTSQKILVDLSEKLISVCPGMEKIFYAGDGSTAVEIALKMSLHARVISQEPHRKQVLSLQNAYHGESILTLSCSDLGLYREPYTAWVLQMPFLQHIPYVTGRHDPLWSDCSANWILIEPQLNFYKDELTAIIVEPIIQAAGGMLIYSQDFLRRLRIWTIQHGIHLIADEIMTGLGRTGYPLACQHAEIEADFVILGKGLTGGFLPFSAVLTKNSIYEIFYDDYDKGKSFLHSNTFCGNALAAALAFTCLQVIENEQIYESVRFQEPMLKSLMQEIADNTKRLKNVRCIGGVVAADLIIPEHQCKKSGKVYRYGYQVFQQSVKFGALLRPLGDTIYWTLPLNVENNTFYELQAITEESIPIAFHF